MTQIPELSLLQLGDIGVDSTGSAWMLLCLRPRGWDVLSLSSGMIATALDLTNPLYRAWIFWR